MVTVNRRPHTSPVGQAVVQREGPQNPTANRPRDTAVNRPLTMHRANIAGGRGAISFTTATSFTRRIGGGPWTRARFLFRGRADLPPPRRVFTPMTGRGEARRRK